MPPLHRLFTLLACLAAPAGVAQVKPTINDTIRLTAYADNWFAIFINGKLVAADAIDFLPHNQIAVRILPEYPLTIAVLAKDNAEPATGLEYGNRIGDAGFILRLGAGTVTSSRWKAKAFHRGPLNRDTVNPRVERIPLPAGWHEPGFDDSAWANAREYLAEQVRPDGDYVAEDFTGARFIPAGSGQPGYGARAQPRPGGLHLARGRGWRRDRGGARGDLPVALSGSAHAENPALHAGRGFLGRSELGLQPLLQFPGRVCRGEGCGGRAGVVLIRRAVLLRPSRAPPGGVNLGEDVPPGGRLPAIKGPAVQGRAERGAQALDPRQAGVRGVRDAAGNIKVEDGLRPGEALAGPTPARITAPGAALPERTDGRLRRVRGPVAHEVL